MPIRDGFAVTGRLRPQDFNKMYHLAALGKVGILRNAVNRGLNIDSVNPNGDTGLCIAVKRKNYVAYNSFRMSGANPRHQCTYRIYKEYQEFLDSTKTAREEKILGNKESLYYNEEERNWWPWILGGVALGGGALALSGGGGGGSHAPVVEEITPIETGTGLGGYVVNYKELISGQNGGNLLDITFENDGLTNPDKIRLLPNTLDMADYLKAYVKIEDGGNFDNWGTLSLGNGTIGMSAYDNGSRAENNGTIDIKAENGAIGMVASNGATAYNSPDLGEKDSGHGNINMSFKGDKEGDSLIGMYADTNSKIVNYGKITGTTSEVVDDKKNNGGNVTGILIGDKTTFAATTDDIIIDEGTGDEVAEEDEEEKTVSPNSGSMVGMGVFNFYSGTDLSKNIVSAENWGSINLSAGYNAATDVGVNLVGMGSYIDDKFLHENYNPSFAEQMKLYNNGNISLKYQGSYKISEGALKLGDGGLIGIRADASTEATNTGNISIDLTSTTLEEGIDVASGMLAVHGAELINGNKNSIYDGSTDVPSGSIIVYNDAKSGGISYGMLAAKGDGSQTRVYNWKDPKLANYGLIDMQVSNSYAMASFDGGEVTNYGVINLGVENGHSYYSNNYGMYSEGKDKADAAKLVNKGIINVNSELSVAMQQMFSGSVDMVNDGEIYLSSKATNSMAMGGSFSTATNNNKIYYEVDNSKSFIYPTDKSDKPDWNVQKDPVAASVKISTENGVTKQFFINDGEMTVGKKVIDENDYNGTFGTAAVHVSQQGGAINNGKILIKKADLTYRQLNVGMYLDSNSERTAYVRNKGDIIVDAFHSMGMLNKSSKSATAFNLGNISVASQRSHGMAGTAGSYLSNGSSDDKSANINVNGLDSVGMYLKDAEGFNWGNIYLSKEKTTAVLLDGSEAVYNEFGNIYHDTDDELKEMVYYGFTNDAEARFDYEGVTEIDGYILGKAFTDDAGGHVYWGEDSVANVTKEYGRLFLVEGKGSEGYVLGEANVSNKATGIEIKKGANGGIETLGVINVKDETATGIDVVDNGSTANVNSGGYLDVKDGIGIQADSLAIVNNNGEISVDSGVGIINGTKVTTTNNGVINVNNGRGAILNGGQFTNSSTGNISISSDTEWDINGHGFSNIDMFSIGGIINSGYFTNKGKIVANDTQKANIGLYVKGSGSVVENNGDVKGAAIGIYADEGSEVINDKNIKYNKVGVYNKNATVVGGGTVEGNTYGYYLDGGTSDLTINGDVEGNTYGVYAKGGNITLTGTLSTGSTGAYLENSSTMTNESGSVIVSGGVGVDVGSGGAFSNYSGITVNSGTGINVRKGGSAVNGSTGVIDVVGESAIGVNVESGGSFTNGGKINFDSNKNSCVIGGSDAGCEDSAKGLSSTVGQKIISLEEGASFINKGIVDFDEEEIDFNEIVNAEDANIVIAKGGSYQAESFKGDVVASKDIVEGGFDDTYTNKDSFVGENKGINVKSQSYMFDAKLNNDGDVELNRKSFEELVEEKDLSEFFEMNYNLAHNEKMYNSLKSAENKEEFDEIKESESGKKFYANLPRENMAVLRGLSSNEQKRILEDGIKDVSIGANYFRTGKDGLGNLSSYEDDVYSAYIGYGHKLNKNWSMGATVMGAYQDSAYDDIDSTKENKILMAFMPILYQNSRFKYLAMPNVGVGFGEYTRHANSGNYDADTFDIYYGLSNTMEYSVDMKVAELVAEAELNLQGIHSDDAKEKGGLVLKANDSVSLEAGVGLKVRKNIRLAKERSLMLAVGAKYYHEFLDPYKKLDVTMKGSPVSFDAGYYEENKNRIKTTAEAVYKDGDLSVSAEISHNNENKSNVEGGVGVRYNF
ncbi:MAG: autotransporter outer membrane beta-barrel domain-containing protein [Alphaproteobacteria bacterium]|nr:autotransporter outer membrane beta-barrel domain-containing protein [Alphaproteobacteria bacterium]